jgi:hypothetical protein
MAIPHFRAAVGIELDGGLAAYRGTFNPAVIGPPLPGAQAFLDDLINAGFQIHLITSRQPEIVHEWLKKYFLEFHFESIHVRPVLFATLGPREITFNGDYAKALADVTNHHPYWKPPHVKSTNL